MAAQAHDKLIESAEIGTGRTKLLSSQTWFRVSHVSQPMPAQSAEGATTPRPRQMIVAVICLGGIGSDVWALPTAAIADLLYLQ